MLENLKIYKLRKKDAKKVLNIQLDSQTET